MIVKESILNLKSFTVIESSIKMLIPEDDEDFSQEYSVDIDFNIADGNDQLKIEEVAVFINIKINQEEKSGYSIAAGGAGIFDFADGITEKDKKELVIFSGVSICINYLRAFVSNLTSYFPLGKYDFPAIDMNDLLDRKYKEDDSKRKKKKSVQTK